MHIVLPRYLRLKEEQMNEDGRKLRVFVRSRLQGLEEFMSPRDLTII